MRKVQSLADLQSLRDEFRAEFCPADVKKVQVKIAMATCGIAAGAKQVMNHMVEKSKELGLDIDFTQAGCMGYCYAEPTLEVSVPGRESVVFGYVDETRADEILTKYIQNNELVEGIIPVNYETTD
ncbi:MAG: (2Fe-2S) ferredoxin domain-containing protein [Bacteroidales bacterium]|nr:(2Fe-2S) ferredoxin domain-containing protein [Bacteroidales bacterium]